MHSKRSFLNIIIKGAAGVVATSIIPSQAEAGLIASSKPGNIFQGITPGKIAAIYVHHTESDRDGAAKIRAYHMNVKHLPDIAYHGVIGNGSLSGDGELELTPRWMRQVTGGGVRDCHANGFDDGSFAAQFSLVGNGLKRPFSKKGLQTLFETIEAVRRKVGKVVVLTHAEVFVKGHYGDSNCPGRFFPFDELHRHFPIESSIIPAHLAEQPLVRVASYSRKNQPQFASLPPINKGMIASR